MNRRYSWTSHSEDESDYQREPDWQEVKFPLKFPTEGVDDYYSREWSVEVTTPDQEIVSGGAKVRRDQVNVSFQPFQEGVHQIQILANGLPFCPPLFFDVLDDGSYRRVAAPPGALQDNEQRLQQPPQARSKAPKKRRDRPLRHSSTYSDEESEPPAGQRVVERRRRPRSVSVDSQTRYSGYIPSESDYYQHRHSRSSSVDRDDVRGRRSRPSSARSGAWQQRDSSVDRPPSAGRSSNRQSVISDTPVPPTRHGRSVSQSSNGHGRRTSRSPSVGQYSRPTSAGSGAVHGRTSSLSRHGSNLSASHHHSRPSSVSRYQRSVSDTESQLSRRNSYSSAAGTGLPGRTPSRRSQSSSRFSSGAEDADILGVPMGRRRSKTTSNLHSTQTPPQKLRHHQSAADTSQPGQRRFKVSASALGAVPVQTAPQLLPQKKSFLGRSNSNPFPQDPGAADYEVMSVPRTGESFIVIDSQMVPLRPLGKTAGGDQMVQSENGQTFLIKHGRAYPMQQGYVDPATSVSKGLGCSSPTAGPPMAPKDGKPRCCVCLKKATNPKKRAQIEGFLYCYKHFKELFFHKPPDHHKKFLFADLMDVPAPGMPVHPRANFTALSFKQFQKAQEEFEKYNTSSTGAIPKDMVFPILKQLLIKNGLKERRLREYFNSPHYPKILMDLQMAEDHSVTELQFLNLLALVTRELTRTWLRKVKTRKPPGKMMRAWSTSALDQGFIPGGSSMHMTSQSSIGLSQNFTGHGQEEMFPEQVHGPHRQAKHFTPAGYDGHRARKPKPSSQSEWSRAESRHSRRPESSDQPPKSRRRSRSRESDDVFPPVHRATHSYQQPAAKGRHRHASEPASRNVSGPSARSHWQREDPEGRSRGDVSPTSSRASGRAGKTTAVIHAADTGGGSISHRSQTQAMPTGKSSNAALTREEALAARAQYHKRLQQQSAVPGSMNEEEDELANDESDSQDENRETTPERPGQRTSQQAQESDESTSEEDEEEEEEEDSESDRVLEESEEEEPDQSDQREMADMPAQITGNRMADAWMLY